MLLLRIKPTLPLDVLWNASALLALESSYSCTAIRVDPATEAATIDAVAGRAHEAVFALTAERYLGLARVGVLVGAVLVVRADVCHLGAIVVIALDVAREACVAEGIALLVVIASLTLAHVVPVAGLDVLKVRHSVVPVRRLKSICAHVFAVLLFLAAEEELVTANNLNHALVLLIV